MLERIPTSVPNLDRILGGGLPKNSILLISGVPGSGKTILAHQIVYGWATPDNRALIITTISEPLSRLIQFTQELSFFDLEKVGKAVLYEDVGPMLLTGNGEEVLAYIRELVARYEPALLVIDSFKAIHDVAESPARLRRTLYRLAAELATLACTTLLVGEYDAEEFAALPETSVVDGIIELRNQPIGLRDYRSLRVRKLRGSGYLSGEHTFRITANGINLFPRFVTPPTPLAYAVSRERATTGIPGLDELLHGGLLRGTTTLIAGDPGVGKTVTALHFLLNGALQGEPGAYISFQEDPSQLAQIARNFGFDVDGLRARGLLDLLYTSPVELDVDEHVLRIVDCIERVKARRVVIDSVADFEAGTRRDEDRYFNYVYSLVQWFKNQGVTAFLTHEMSRLFAADLTLTGRGVSHIADNVILLRYVPFKTQIRRAITVLSARGSSHSNEVREFIISEEKGIRIGGTIAGAFSILEG